MINLKIIFILSSSYLLNFVLPECRPNFAEVAQSTSKLMLVLGTVKPSLSLLTNRVNDGYGRNNDRANGGSEHLEIKYETECRK
jgi:hypothetical protein